MALRAALSFAIRTCTYLGRDVAWDGERFELKGTGEVRRRRGRRRRDRAPDVAPSPVGAGRLESPFARRLGGVRVSTEPGQVKRVLVADSRTRCRARDISHAPR